MRFYLWFKEKQKKNQNKIINTKKKMCDLFSANGMAGIMGSYPVADFYRSPYPYYPLQWVLIFLVTKKTFKLNMVIWNKTSYDYIFSWDILMIEMVIKMLWIFCCSK